jgi:type II secretion system protein N
MTVPRWVKLVGYPSWFGACFVFSLYLTFPIDVIESQVVDAAENALGKGKQGRYGVDPKVEIGEMSLWRFSGVKLERVSVQLASNDPDPGPTLDVDEMGVRIGVLGLLFNEPSIKFFAELWQGDLSGSVAMRGDKKAEDEFLGHTFALFDGKAQDVSEIDLEINDVDLSRSLPVAQKLGVPVTGKVGGVVHVEMGEKPQTDAAGEIDLAIKGVTAGPGERDIPLMGKLTVPLIEMGDLEAKAKIEKGKGKFDKLGLDGKDFQADVDGDISFGRALKSSRLKADGWFKLSEDFLEKNTKFQIIDALPGISKAKDDQGQYHFTVGGNVSKPRFNLSKSAGKKKARRTRSRRNKTPAADKE